MPVYSHSRLKVYETCPKQYEFQYIRKPDLPEVEPIEWFLGNRVHETLEALYLNVRFGRVPPLEGLLGHYRDGWREAWHEDVRIQQADLTAEDYRREGERQIEAYYQRYAPFDHDHTLAVERRLHFPLDHERTVWFQGYMDRLSRTPDGAWQIRDYKTGQYLPAQGALDRDRQLGLYQLGVRHQWPQAQEVELVWHFLAHDLELRSRPTPEALEDVRGETLDLIRRVGRDDTYPTRVGDHCERCTYQSICPAWAHRFKREEASGEAAVRWVDRLGELKEQQKTIEDELEDLRVRIAEYAALEGVEAVFGTAHRASVRRTERFAYPRTKDPRRQELESLLRRSGRWEEVSMLNARQLPDRVRSGEWPADLVEAVRPFERREETVTVRVGRWKDPGRI